MNCQNDFQNQLDTKKVLVFCASNNLHVLYFLNKPVTRWKFGALNSCFV